MKLKRFTQFVNESTDDAEELAAFGFNSKIDTDEIQGLMAEYNPEEKTDTTLGFDLGFDMTAGDLGIDPERAEAAELDDVFLVQYYVDFDFETMKAKVQVAVLNAGIDFDGAGNAYEVDFKLDSENHDSQGIADELTKILQRIEYEGMFVDMAVDIVNDIIDRRLGEVSEKKKLKWHDSDAPDANGKFKELGVNKLADWLIKTRGGNMQKITGSLNQQINFNKRKNPSYAKKMESTREAVKRKLKKD